MRLSFPGRMGRPAGSLTRPLANLIELGYVRKEVPFGEAERSGRRTLYRLNDPFLWLKNPGDAGGGVEVVPPEEVLRVLR